MILDYLTQFRWLWIAGRPGGGKTSLALSLAYKLYRSGYVENLAMNTPLLRGGTLIGEVPTVRDVYTYTNTCLIMDEAWLYIGSGAGKRNIAEALGFIRKNNNFLIAPSVLELVRELRVLIIRRRFNFSPLGVNLWCYRWSLNTTIQRESGWYFWWHPERIFGSYDHLARPDERYYVYRLGD